MTDKFVEIEYKYLAGDTSPELLEKVLTEVGGSAPTELSLKVTVDKFYLQESELPVVEGRPLNAFARIRFAPHELRTEITIKSMINSSLAIRNEVNLPLEASKDAEYQEELVQQAEKLLSLFGCQYHITLIKDVRVYEIGGACIAWYDTTDPLGRSLAFIEIEVTPARGIEYLNYLETFIGKRVPCVHKSKRLNHSLLSIFTTMAGEYKDKFRYSDVHNTKS